MWLSDTWSYVLWVCGGSVSLKPYRINFAEGQDKFSQKNRITTDLPSHRNACAPPEESHFNAGNEARTA